MRRYPTLVVALPSLLVSDLQAQEPPSARASGPAPVAAQQTASQTPPATPPEPSELEWSTSAVIDATGSGVVVHRSDKAEQLMHVNRSPVGSVFGFYVGGQKGPTVSVATSFYF